MIGETMNSNERKSSTTISDITSLVKAVVLIANVLPVFTGFWLALYFTNTSLAAHWDTLLLTLIGSTLVMAGALMFNNWYEVDLDKKNNADGKSPDCNWNNSTKCRFNVRNCGYDSWIYPITFYFS